jgi:branched-chain amino acid transport system ATP-binding protein
VLVIEQGSCIARGTPDQIQADPRVLDAYLGQDYRVEQVAAG